jgi:predicted Zn-dependent protease
MRVRQCAILVLATALRAQDLTHDKEAALGNQIASELRAHANPIQNSAVQTYIEALGARLAAAMPGAQFPFNFTVVARDFCPSTHEPASLPGGYILVPAALFSAALNEAEFAAMLAHAMEHVVARHSLATRVSPATPNTIPLIFIGGQGGNCAEHSPIPVAYRARARLNELEADALAIPALERAGFDPAALLNYLRRTDPSSPRVDALNQLIATLPVRTYPESNSGFVTARQAIAALSPR